jgi:hypothetical protein
MPLLDLDAAVLAINTAATNASNTIAKAATVASDDIDDSAVNATININLSANNAGNVAKTAATNDATTITNAANAAVASLTTAIATYRTETNETMQSVMAALTKINEQLNPEPESEEPIMYYDPLKFIEFPLYLVNIKGRSVHILLESIQQIHNNNPTPDTTVIVVKTPENKLDSIIIDLPKEQVMTALEARSKEQQS